jgi:hypothetical protein
MGVKETPGATDLRDLFHRKQNAGLIVRPHQRNDRGIGPDCFLDFGKIDISILIDADERYFATAALKFLGMPPHCAVFNRTDDNVFVTRLMLARKQDFEKPHKAFRDSICSWQWNCSAVAGRVKTGWPERPITRSAAISKMSVNLRGFLAKTKRRQAQSRRRFCLSKRNA